MTKICQNLRNLFIGLEKQKFKKYVQIYLES